MQKPKLLNAGVDHLGTLFLRRSDTKAFCIQIVQLSLQGGPLIRQ